MMKLSKKEPTSTEGMNSGTYKKSELTTTTVSKEAFMIIPSIEAKEKRDMTAIDITNGFIQTQQHKNEKLIICLRGIMVEIMCMIVPEIYQPYLQFERGNKFLYVQALNAIYKQLKPALIKKSVKRYS